jgi:hypothetical protein
MRSLITGKSRRNVSKTQASVGCSSPHRVHTFILFLFWRFVMATKVIGDLVTIRPPFWKEPCPQRILMVTDGGLDFGTLGFGFSEFVKIVVSRGHTVTTAHRGSGVAMIALFKFNAATVPVTLANYDQLWLFGFESGPFGSPSALPPVEASVIAAFMQAGGGVFATGDHETLGQAMGASLPRIRSMREWANVNGGNQNRLDTVIDPGGNGTFQFDDQSNKIAQRIYPYFFGSGATWSPHALLRHASGQVDFLPDHPHESECYAPPPVAGSFAGVVEWPADSSGTMVAAVKVAMSVSAGRYLTDSGKPPVQPRCFLAISAYDGDTANVGRIVCESTWHHYTNINLNGTDSVQNDLNSGERAGLYTSPGVPTPEYLKIRAYWANAVNWLAPKNRRLCWIWTIWNELHFSAEMREMIKPEKLPAPWSPLLQLGSLAEAALREIYGPGAMEDLVSSTLDQLDKSEQLRALLQTGMDTKSEVFKSRSQNSTLMPLQDIRRVILGSVITAMHHQIPADEAAYATLQKRGRDKLATDLLTQGVRAAETATFDYLQAAIKGTSQQLMTLQSLQAK